VRAVEPPSPPVKAYAVPRLAMFGIFLIEHMHIAHLNFAPQARRMPAAQMRPSQMLVQGIPYKKEHVQDFCLRCTL